MKKMKYSIFILLGVLIFASCKEDFLDTYPTTSVSATDALASTGNAYAALNGIHRIMYVQYDAQGQAGEGSINLFRDYMGEDIVFPRAGGSTAYIGIMRWQDHRNVNDADPRYVYRFYYRLIANANVLINGIDEVPGAQSDDAAAVGALRGGPAAAGHAGLPGGVHGAGGGHRDVPGVWPGL